MQTRREFQNMQLSSNQATQNSDTNTSGSVIDASKDSSIPTAVAVTSGMPHVSYAIEELIMRIANTLTSDPEVWDILAEFHSSLDGLPIPPFSTSGPGPSQLNPHHNNNNSVTEDQLSRPSAVNNYNRGALIRDSRMKQMRALINEPHWEKDMRNIENIATCAADLVNSHRRNEVTKSDLYAVRSLLQSVVRTIDAQELFLDSEAYFKTKSLLVEVEYAYTTGIPLTALIVVNDGDGDNEE